MLLGGLTVSLLLQPQVVYNSCFWFGLSDRRGETKEHENAADPCAAGSWHRCGSLSFKQLCQESDW